MVKYGPKDFEVYVGKNSTFDVSTISNDESLAKFFDDAVTALEVTDLIKLADTNSCSVDPAEDGSTTKKYIGSTPTGAQNSDLFLTEEADVSLSINADPAIIEQLTPYALENQGATHIGFADYARFNLGAKATDEIVLLIRVAKTVGANTYYKNWLFVGPEFSKVDSLDISGDDDVASVDYALKGTKAYTDKDFYSGATPEVVVNLTQ